MINLPHKLDVVSLVATTDAFVFEPQTTSDVGLGKIYRDQPLGSINISRTDKNNKQLPDIAPLPDKTFRPVTIRLRGILTNNDPFDITYPNMLLTRHDDYYHIEFSRYQYFYLYYRIPDFTQNQNVTINISTPDLKEDNRGILYAQIDCLVSQYARSFDEDYQERYSVVSKYHFNVNRDNLYLFVPNGIVIPNIRTDLSGFKVERLQYSAEKGLSTITCLALPAAYTTPPTDTTEFTYTEYNSTQERTVTVETLQAQS